jgi:hypothetical protein
LKHSFVSVPQFFAVCASHLFLAAIPALISKLLTQSTAERLYSCFKTIFYWNHLHDCCALRVSEIYLEVLRQQR